MTAEHPDPIDPADDLRRAWRPVAPGTCPSEDAWAELAAGTMDTGERERVAAHVVRCPSCVKTWRAIAALGPAPSLDELAARRRRFRRGRWVAAIAVAAAAAAALMIFWKRDPGGERDVVRGGSAASIEVTSPRGAVARDVVFAWTPIAKPGSIDGYVVHVVTGDGRPVWTSPRVAAPPIALPAANASPGRYAWYVEAVRGERAVAASRNTEFAIAP